MFSVEIPDNITEFQESAFGYCYCLRNVAFPPNAVFGDRFFVHEGPDKPTDLHRLFGLEIIRELIRQFDRLPIHKLVYQSFLQGVLQKLIAAINSGSRTLCVKLEPTGNQQDCLGMTPLHILACSSVHDLELYRVIVKKYPANLIIGDRWGALPLLYAFWGSAPAEIIQFMIESYQALYPGYEFNWANMVETMGRTDTPKERIENLLHVKQMHFPEQPIDWEYLLDKFTQPSMFHMPGVVFKEQMHFFVMCGLSDRVESLAFKVWRYHITQMIHAADFKQGDNNSDTLHSIQEKLAYFEDELPNLKEVTIIIELALWKVRMTMNENIHQEFMCSRQKKVRVDQSKFRWHCRITCGANVVIGHVPPFLITT